MSSDQRFTNIAGTGQVKTISGGSTKYWFPCRITYIQAKGQLVLLEFKRHFIWEHRRFYFTFFKQKV